MADEKTYTEEQVRKIIDHQVLMNNIEGFFQIALANGRNWGMTSGMIADGKYCYQLITSPPSPQKKEPEKVSTEPASPE
jgi:hypothetical protein